MNTTHTPGPWVVDGDDIIARTRFGVYIAKEGDGRVAQAFSNCLVTTDAECLANARLIAAAPELLEACKAVISEHAAFVASHAGLRLTDEAACVGMCRAAIAKAIGEQA